jgi:alkylation response protein AidB-like acyl-CoA dehydrogenase
VELGLVMEELGRGLYNGPFLSSVCLAAGVLGHAATEDERTALLPGLATGEVRAALAFAEPGGRWDGADPTTVVRDATGDPRVSGSKTLVVDGASAELLLVTARGPEGLSLLAIDAGVPGVSRRRLPTLDQTREFALVELADVPATLIGVAGGAGPHLRRTLQEAAVFLAAEQLGGAARCLEMAVDYAKIREQFGRAIGSFQAIKHRCVDMLTDVESSRSAVLLALTAMAAVDVDLTELSSLARAHCSEAFSRVALANVQIHGGIGFTWEHDAHLFLKRAKASEALLGSPTEHRELLASAMGL